MSLTVIELSPSLPIPWASESLVGHVDLVRAKSKAPECILNKLQTMDFKRLQRNLYL